MSTSPRKLFAKPSFIRIIDIRVPPTTKWEAKASQQLMHSLFALIQLQLFIHATAEGIQWQVEVPHTDVEAAVKILYAHYPQAQITTHSKVMARVTPGHLLFQFHMVAPYPGPLMHAEDFGRLDPLVTLVSGMTNLKPEEHIVYEVGLKSAEEKVYQLGEKLVTKSLTKWWHFLTPQTAGLALARKAFDTDQVEAYAPQLQKLLEAKLNSALKCTTLALKIRAATKERAYALLNMVYPGLVPFERVGSNFLVQPQAESFPLVLSAKEVAALWHLPTEQCQAPGVLWSAGPAAPAPPTVTEAREGIQLGVNVYQNREQAVWLRDQDRVTHVNIIGKTGTGKSTLLHRLIHQDIKAGKAVGVIDPHGDLIDRVLTTSIPPEREEDVILFDMRDDAFPIGLNLFAAPDGVSPDVVASQALGICRKMFADNWSGGRMEDALYAALIALSTTPGSTIADIQKMFHNPAFRARILAQVTDPIALEFWYDEYEPASAGMQREIARPITTRIRKFYRNKHIYRVLGQETSLDFGQILDTGKIFLASLSGITEIEAETLGALLISKFQIAAISRGRMAETERTPFYLYVDEVQKFSTTSLPIVFSEARKYGLSLVVANQFLQQLAGDTLEAVMGNVGTSILFGVGHKDAATLGPYLKPTFAQEDLSNLSRFHAIVKMQAATQAMPAFSLQTLPPLPIPKKAASTLERIEALSREKYAQPQATVEAMLAERARNQPESIQEDEEASYFG